MKLLFIVVFGVVLFGISGCTASKLTYDFVSVDRPKVINTLAKNRERVEQIDLSQGLASLSQANRFAICTKEGLGYELLQPKYESGRICGEDNLDIYNIDLLCFEWADIHSVGKPIQKKTNLETKRKDIVQGACEKAFNADH